MTTIPVSQPWYVRPAREVPAVRVLLVVGPLVALALLLGLVVAPALIRYGRNTAPVDPLRVASQSCTSDDGNLYVVTEQGGSCLRLGNLGRLALGLGS